MTDQKENAFLRLYLVRHGETADNIGMRYLGIRDQPLTAKGMQQARQVATALAALAVRAVISSPMRRAVETARQVESSCGVELRLDARLAEGSFGRWEGLSRAEVLTLSSTDAEQLRRWESDPSFAPPGGESIEHIQKRVLELVHELWIEFQNSSLVLVSHVGPIKALLAAALGISLQATRRLILDPATISVVEWGPYPVVRLVNSHAHLGWASARWMQSPGA